MDANRDWKRDGKGEWEQSRDIFREDEADDHFLPTISLIHVPHHKIRGLYQRCYEYVEPWQWSAGAELVETGRWFYGPAKTGL